MRFAERALFGGVSAMAVRVTDIAGFTTGGLNALSIALRTGERLPAGVDLSVVGPQGGAVLVALCRIAGNRSRPGKVRPKPAKVRPNAARP
jgi:hypothetical protein